ncbi:phosphotransferase [Candidatus Dojkabacteria bacterium]|nr:phosphotransferase [Candidatus Dojkabacteria bacterium]
MKFSEVLSFIKKKYDKNLIFVKKYKDGFRNDVFKVKEKDTGKFFVLIVYKKEAGIERIIKNAHAVAHYLKTKNFPVRTLFKLKSKKSNKEDEDTLAGRYIALYNHLPGHSIPWEAYKRRHLKSIGKTLSDMHFEIKNFKKGKCFPLWKKEIIREIDSIQKYFKKVEPWILKKLKLKLNWTEIENTADFSSKIFYNKNQTMLHYDFVRGNILFSNKVLDDDTSEITGILDFEKVCIGPAIADVARTLSFLIVDCKYKNEEEVKKWFLERGYKKRGKCKTIHNEFVLESLIKIFWLRDFYKFLLHNPYEDLLLNEHFLRTRDKLLGKNLLTEAR